MPRKSHSAPAAAPNVEPAGEFTMPAGTYAVLKRVPIVWWSETDAKASIAASTGQLVASVGKRLAYLIRVGLVERRPALYGSLDDAEIKRVDHAPK